MLLYQAPLKDINFLLYELFSMDQLWKNWSSVAEITEKQTLQAILEEASRLAVNTIAPLNQQSDAQGCSFKEGKVFIPQAFEKVYQLLCEGGWTSLSGDTAYGAMGLPHAVSIQFDEMLSSACLSFSLYSGLTHGAALTLLIHGNEQLKATYLSHLYSGKWTGTMCLTEAHAGTDLGLIKTTASLESDNTYRLQGSKIFITAGEHQLTENIIHLVLARIEGAPQGTKGISLFLVPKFLVNDDGSLGERNSVSCGSIEKKMGIHGASTCVMNFDNALGFLVGEPNKGLAAMFTMMNKERLFVGIQGLGCSVVAYQNALAYAQERLQGRSATGAIAKHEPADPIIVHGDIRRTLLNHKVFNEGARAFSTFVAMQIDIADLSENETHKKQAEAMVALMTPIVKSFFTDQSFEFCVQAQQVLGGHGYIKEWGFEQLVRDVRITQIYEGTNGIQALDLLGRKVIKDQGKVLSLWLKLVESDIEKSSFSEMGDQLQSLVNSLAHLTEQLIQKSVKDPNSISVVCKAYLNICGYVALGWMWLRMADTAKNSSSSDSFYTTKQKSASYYFQYLLPKGEALVQEVISSCDTELMYQFCDDDF